MVEWWAQVYLAEQRAEENTQVLVMKESLCRNNVHRVQDKGCTAAHFPA